MPTPSPPQPPLRRPLPHPPPPPSLPLLTSTPLSPSPSPSPTPPPPPPPRRVSRLLQSRHDIPTGSETLNEAARGDATKLQIRLVPYSPPRLSSDGSLSSSSRPVSYADPEAAVALSSSPLSSASASASPRPTVRRDLARHGDEDGSLSPDVSEPNVLVHACSLQSLQSLQSLHPQQPPSLAHPTSPSPEGPSASATTTSRRLWPGLPGTGGAGPNPSPGMTLGNDPGLPVNASSTSVISPISQPDRPSSATSSIGSRSSHRSRRNRVINLHANNKTFSLAPLSGSLSSRTDSFTTGPPSLATSSSSYGRVSSASVLYTDDRPISPLTSVGEQPGACFRSTGSPASTLTSIPDITTASPWNYRLVGGLRKVRDAPVDEPESEPGPSRVGSNLLSNSSSHESLPSLPPLAVTKPSSDRLASASLAPKVSYPSSESSQSGSTVSERTNYKVYGQSSPGPSSSHLPAKLDTQPPSSGHSSNHSDENYHIIARSSPPAAYHHRPAEDAASPPPPSSSHSDINYKIIGQSSPVVAVRYRTTDSPASRHQPSRSNANYEILGESSSSNHSLYEHQRPQTGDSDANYVVHHTGASTASLVTTGSRVRPEYSQESLIVPPLRPGRQSSIESLRLAAKRSRDSLRSGSFTSLSSVITQEAARALFVGPSSIYIPPSIRKENNSRPVAKFGGQMGSSMIQSHPHQWSSQLSTVPSESEPSSRSLSPISEAARRSSFFSHRSVRMRSISSSLAGPRDSLSRSASHSLPESVDHPQAAHVRHSSREESLSPRLIRDHDEDGDGLADLEDLRHRQSRTRLSSILSHQSSDRNLRSSGSSRSNSLSSSLPAWARVYYGSGERRFVVTHPSTESMYSLYNETPRSGSRSGSLLRHSPSAERFMIPIRNSRRRPREQQYQSADEAIQRDPTQEPELESQQEDAHPVLQVARRIRKQTSSIWSPHLAYDRRATRYSIWEPPSTTWSEDAGILSRRNIQVILFIAGFVFPIAWMIAALLPLPASPKLEMAEVPPTTSNLDLQQVQHPHYMPTVDQVRYNSARWWRNLNRIMSIVGLLIIGAIITLAILGVQRQW